MVVWRVAVGLVVVAFVAGYLQLIGVLKGP
jgi:hypothetical protein